MKRKNKGFTLIELLAVIVILGLLMAIAIPSVTKYITQSRKKTVTTTIGNYIGALTNQVNDMEYTFTGANTIYAVPIECISVERGGTNPFGKWYQANNSYWAYVLVQYDDATSSYTYGFTFKDSAGYGLYPTTIEKLNESGKQIQTGLSLNRPEDGIYTKLTAEENWQNSGFILNSTTQISVLESSSEGEKGDGVNTCTLCQKGDNYDAVEEEKIERAEALEADEGTLKNDGITTTVVFGKSLDRTKIESIEFLNHKRPPKGAEWWDASQEQNLSIKAWILDEDNDGLYELYVGQKGGVTTPADCSYMFFGFSKVVDLDLTYFNEPALTNMLGMFALMQSVKSIDLSGFNTSNVTNMASLFWQCLELENINISSFNTAKVTNMANMFANCYKIKTLNLSHFNTSKVTNMRSMFWHMNSLTSVNVSSFNTSNVEFMDTMFAYTTSLISLNLSNFNTSKVTDMSAMFWNSNVGTLNLGNNFNTSKVTSMNQMFQNAPNVKTTITIRNGNMDLGFYGSIFDNAATTSGAYIRVNYTSSSLSVVNNMMTYCKSSNANVYKGSRVS